MKKLLNCLFLAGAIAAASVMTGCATASSIGGTSDLHGLISKANEVAKDADAIASYSIILGLLDSGYEEYVTKVKAAEAEGQQITTVTTQYLGFFTKITAYAKAK